MAVAATDRVSGMALARMRVAERAAEEAERQILHVARCGLPKCRFQRTNISLAKWIPLRDSHRASEHPGYRKPKTMRVGFGKNARRVAQP